MNHTRRYGEAAANSLKNPGLSHSRYHKWMGMRLTKLCVIHKHSIPIGHSFVCELYTKFVK